MLSTPILIIALILASGCFSAAETALFAASRVRIKTLVSKGNSRAILVDKLRSDPRRLLGTILVSNMIVTIGASSLTTVYTIQTVGDAYVGITAGLITVLIIIFAEFVPKSYAAHQPEKVAFMLVGFVSVLSRLLGPAIAVLEKVTDRFFRGQLQEKRPGISEDEIRTMVTMGAESGTIKKVEKELIERVFLFNDITAEDVMTRKEQITFLDGDQPLASALEIINDSRYSRFPVYEKDREKIVGIIHIKEILEMVIGRGGKTAEGLLVKDLATHTFFVPATKPIDELFREFQKAHVHMAVVINEFGSVLGLITVDDLLEELVGEISDESDIDEHVFKRVDKLTIVTHGDAEIKDINRFFSVAIDAPENKTLSWVLMERSGCLPQAGQRIAIQENLSAVIETMHERHIEKVRLIKADLAAPTQA